MTTATGALAEAETTEHESDDSLAEFQWRLSVAFSRARLLWKESAARIHPDLQPSGYKLLGFVARAGEANAHHLAEAFEMDKSVVSRQVRALEELGLVVSRPDADDGRQRVLAATPAAHEALEALRADRFRRTLANMTATTAEPASADAVASARTAEATAAAPNTPDAAAQAREGAILRLSLIHI